MKMFQAKTRNNALNNIWAMIQKEYWCLIWNMNMQSASSIWSNLLSNATGNIIEIVRNCVRGGEANVYGSSYYWNFRTSSFKQVACLILCSKILQDTGEWNWPVIWWCIFVALFENWYNVCIKPVFWHSTKF